MICRLTCKLYTSANCTHPPSCKQNIFLQSWIEHIPSIVNNKYSFSCEQHIFLQILSDVNSKCKSPRWAIPIHSSISYMYPSTQLSKVFDHVVLFTTCDLLTLQAMAYVNVRGPLCPFLPCCWSGDSPRAFEIQKCTQCVCGCRSDEDNPPGVPLIF